MTHPTTKNAILERANGTLRIELTQGKSMICDDKPEVWDLLGKHRYYARSSGGVVYAMTNIQNPSGTCYTSAYFHRQIHPSLDGLVTDHRNKNTLDNRATNLRSIALCVKKSKASRKYKSNTTGVTGVYEVNDDRGRSGWSVRWQRPGAKGGSKYFSSDKYGGREKAFELAKAHRAQMMSEQEEEADQGVLCGTTASTSTTAPTQLGGSV